MRAFISFVKRRKADTEGILEAEPEVAGHMARQVRLNPDVWDMIIRNLDNQQDLYNLCLVSKDLYPLVVPHLYRTILIGCEPREPWRSSWFDIFDPEKNRREPGVQRSRVNHWSHLRPLIRRLVDNPGGQQAHAVRELEISHLQDGSDEDAALVSVQEEALMALVKFLPNLQHVRIQSPTPRYEQLIRAVNDHKNRPELQLLAEDGSRSVAGPLPSVTTLRARVNPLYEKNGEPNRRMIAVQQLFFACTNLKSACLAVHKYHGGCGRPIPRHAVIYSFQLTGEETFPPLESLWLDGYPITPAEWVHWRDGLDWSKLASLSLGPQDCTPFLTQLTRSRVHAKYLRSFTLQSWPDDYIDSTSYEELEEFLVSFGSLERLTVKGHFLANRAMCNHARLKRLCLHAIELPRDGAPRPTLDVADLSELDAKCSDLEELEVDIYRDKSGWPKDITAALASGFTKLRHLTLHAEVGIDWEDFNAYGPDGALAGQEPLRLPRLNAELAKAFAEPFFARRGQQTRLQTLTIRTGENLRRFPQRPLAYGQHELEGTATIHIRPPSSPGAAPAVVVERLAWP